jgi:uncharacterized membrane protein YkoI
MKSQTLLALGIAAMAVAHGHRASAAAKTLKQGDVPAPVMTKLAAKYPGAKWKSFGTEDEHGATVYEVEFTQGKGHVSVDVSPEGKILAEETTLTAGELPAPVKDSIDGSKYKGWKLLKAERVIDEEQTDAPTYEVMLERKGKKVELVVDKSGKIAKESAKGKNDTD